MPICKSSQQSAFILLGVQLHPRYNSALRQRPSAPCTIFCTCHRLLHGAGQHQGGPELVEGVGGRGDCGLGWSTAVVHVAAPGAARVQGEVSAGRPSRGGGGGGALPHLPLQPARRRRAAAVAAGAAAAAAIGAAGCRRPLPDTRPPMQPTHYTALGVEPGAGGEELRRAYKAAALRTHPDKAAGGAAPAEYLRVQAAWEALADPARRATYDRHLALEAARQEVAVSETVALAEMGEASVEGQACRSWPCRCGGAYLLPADEEEAAAAAAGAAGSRELLVPCSTCSLYIRAVG